MPIHLPAQSRRQFLITVGAGVLTCSSEAFGSETEGDLVYLLNDTHIGEIHPPKSPVPTHLRQAVDELLERNRKPACVLINGDLLPFPELHVGTTQLRNDLIHCVSVLLHR
jgi:hypothetical protein